MVVVMVVVGPARRNTDVTQQAQPLNLKRSCALCGDAAAQTINEAFKSVPLPVTRESDREVEFVFILCREQQGGGGRQAEHRFNSQLRQISVLLKSAAALTSRRLKFNIISDSIKTHHEIINLTLAWPDKYRKAIVFSEYKEVYYPPGAEKMRSMFRECATERLFLPHLYQGKEALVFLDTDVLFLRPPEKLWHYYDEFKPWHVIGMAPSLYYYGTQTKFPIYRPTGLNAGVLLMNLSRLLAFPGGWTELVMRVTEEYQGKLYLADQDILNIVFSEERSGEVYQLDCHWNYRANLCALGINKCKAAEQGGISLLHGAGRSFVDGNEKKFQVVFEAWEKHQLGQPLAALVTRLQDTLRSQGWPTWSCGRLPSINELLLEGLRGTVQLQEEENNK